MTTFLIEAPIPFRDHRGTIIGYDNEIVWEGASESDARANLPKIKAEFGAAYLRGVNENGSISELS